MNITPKMVEAGAIALRELILIDGAHGTEWTRLSETLRDEYREMAYAVLRAVSIALIHARN